MSHWVKWVDYVGVQYPIPNKYKSSAPGTERYNLFRLAELYLVRAEASAQMEDIASAVTDINVLRSRAGLLPISDAISKVECLQAIAHERQVELFAETGHRWLDLKRTGQLDAVLQPLKSATWAPHAALFPIPLADLQNNPQLEQNPGY